MKKPLVLVVILALCALALLGLYLSARSSAAKVAADEEAARQQLSALEQENQRLAAEQAAAAEAAEKARLAAAEAERMAALKAQRDAEEQQKRLAELNARLEREAAERREAEEQVRLLEERITALAAAQDEARRKLSALEASQQAEQAAALAADLQKREAELAALRSENDALKERAQVLLARQVATEEEIISEGGRVTIAHPEIRSPNVRRQEAIYLKQRQIGTAPGN